MITGKMSKTYNGTNFVFAHWNQQESSWVITGIRFLINSQTNNRLCGQYITSMWYNVEMEVNKTQAYVVIGVRDEKQLKKIELFMNRHNNKIPSKNDIPNDVDFCEYFEIPINRVKDIRNEKKEKRELIKGSINKQNELNIQFYHRHEKFLSTLPDFNIEIPF
tara:strand:+ start:462 stop:950 length:489 start_codon:yes stop_codon:yes gene_type:complete